jgi:peptide/nickel transport system ATP-binding protein
VLLADEPTTALDVTVQIQILLLLRKLQREFGMAVIFVTHDVGVSVEIADRLAVMYAGRFVETGPMDAVIRAPRHPYTQGLLASSVHGSFRDHRLEPIPGMPPALNELSPGCTFAPRCRYVEDRCVATDPPEYRVAPDHAARCVRASDGSLPVFGTATATLSPAEGERAG